jgi:hypothetical protein
LTVRNGKRLKIEFLVGVNVNFMEEKLNSGCGDGGWKEMGKRGGS